MIGARHWFFAIRLEYGCKALIALSGDSVSDESHGELGYLVAAQGWQAMFLIMGLGKLAVARPLAELGSR